MTFAIAISLVLIISTATLLYQYLTHVLAAEGRQSTAGVRFPARPARPSRIDARPLPHDDFRADTAA